MRIFNAILLILAVGVLPGYAASKGIAVQTSTATLKGSGQSREAGGFSGKIKKINDAAISEKKEDREGLAVLGSRIQKDIKDLEVDQDFIKAARDKSLDWKTRYLLIERMGQEDEKKITKDGELTLYSDTLSDAQEHGEVRKLAAQSLMEPARTEAKAREALARAAKDKSLPGEVLWSVMVSVGSSGIDDADVLAELMNREPKTNNEIGINLNAVRALGGSRDPRAVGMLFKILDESGPDSFFNVTALEQFSRLIKDPEKEKKLRPMLVPRLMKLLEDRGSHIGASRNLSGRILVRMQERKAIGPIMKWLKPKSEGGGVVAADVGWAAEILAEFQAKEAIPELQKVIDNVPHDSRWAEYKKLSVKQGFKFPEEAGHYRTVRECLKKLKGEPYDKKYVSLPWEYD